MKTYTIVAGVNGCGKKAIAIIDDCLEKGICFTAFLRLIEDF